MTRDVVLSALLAVNSGVGADSALNSAVSKAGLDRRDTALCFALCYGVLQTRYKLDSVIMSVSTLKRNKIAPKVMEILRIGAYQMLYMDKIPHSAAVNESVKLARKHTNPRAAGFVNAVLRKVSAIAANNIPETSRDDLSLYLSTELSFPVWFCDYMRRLLGDEDAEKFLRASSVSPAVTARINTLVCDVDRAKDILRSENVDVIESEYSPEIVYLQNLGNPEELSSFRDGIFSVQDAASQFCVYALSPTKSSTIIDVCAAPGGKSFACAAFTDNTADIRSFDVAASKLEAMEKNARRLSVTSMRVACMDASNHVSNLENSADFLLCDVPCSGMGVIRKKPDIRYKDREEVMKLPALQYSILENVSTYVKSGGVLVYSTCTVLREENEDIVNKFLANNPDFSLESFTLPGLGEIGNGHITLYPHIHNTDGFFIAKLRKK